MTKTINSKPKQFSPIKLVLFPLFIGFTIFVISETFGQFFALMLFITTRRTIGIDLPVPYHLQSVPFLLAVVLICVSFLTIFHNRTQRFITIVVILFGFFVLFPVSWLYITSHGHIDMTMYKLTHLTQTLKQANTSIEEEKIIEIPTNYGLYRYRFYYDRRNADYVYEIWHNKKLVHTDKIYHFTRHCLKSEPKRCLVISLPYTLVDLRKVDIDYEQAIITSGEEVTDITGDGIKDLVVHEYSGNGDISSYRIFSLGETIAVENRPAPEPKFKL